MNKEQMINKIMNMPPAKEKEPNTYTPSLIEFYKSTGTIRITPTKIVHFIKPKFGDPVKSPVIYDLSKEEYDNIIQDYIDKNYEK